MYILIPSICNHGYCNLNLALYKRGFFAVIPLSRKYLYNVGTYSMDNSLAIGTLTHGGSTSTTTTTGNSPYYPPHPIVLIKLLSVSFRYDHELYDAYLSQDFKMN